MLLVERPPPPLVTEPRCDFAVLVLKPPGAGVSMNMCSRQAVQAVAAQPATHVAPRNRVSAPIRSLAKSGHPGVRGELAYVHSLVCCGFPSTRKI